MARARSLTLLSKGTVDRRGSLVLTGRASVGDRVEGLDAGADDYLVKPFAFPELLARVRACSRRSRGDQLLRLSIADLTMDVASRVGARRVNA